MNYHVARNGQQLGVLSSTDISLKLSTGDLSPQDLAWTEGMTNWQPISTISGLAAGGPPSLPDEVNPYAAPRAEISVKRGTAELASLGQRLGAAVLDILVILPAAFCFGFAGALADKNGDLTPVSGTLMAVAGIYVLGLMIYNLVRLSTHGQTLGKQWMSIRIASYEDDSNAGFVKAVLLRGFVNGLIGAVPLLGMFYSLTDIGFIFRDDHRCIHDLIAGTHVVKV
jgi:uncharacterized RDD family membrane protein YckC